MQTVVIIAYDNLRFGTLYYYADRISSTAKRAGGVSSVDQLTREELVKLCLHDAVVEILRIVHIFLVAPNDPGHAVTARPK